MRRHHVVQVGEPHVNRHWSHHAAAAETDGPGSSCLQRRLIATSGMVKIQGDLIAALAAAICP